MSSHRTVASSKGAATATHGKSVISNSVKFEEFEYRDEVEEQKERNWNLKLCEDPDELMLQRKQRFEALR